MAQAKIHLIDSNHLGDFYFTQDAPNLATHLFALGRYTASQDIEVFGIAEDACEELFDLTNNAYRQGERVVKYGRGRSLSVGDMVEVGNVFYVCRPNGWLEVDLA